MNDVRFPNEPPGYRAARDALTQAETELTRHIETVAERRRSLPLGGVVAEDYTFSEGPADLHEDGPARPVRLSALFGTHDTLLLYSFMYSPEMARPCRMCTSLLDGLDGAVPDLADRAAVAVVAKSPIGDNRSYARTTQWCVHRLAGREVAEALRAAIPGSRLVLVPAAGHDVNLEAPEEYDAAVRAFVRD